MIDHEEIYRSEAERYDLLVSREDYQGHILPALREIRDLAGLEVAEWQREGKKTMVPECTGIWWRQI